MVSSRNNDYFCMLHERFLVEINILCSEDGGTYDPEDTVEIGEGGRRLTEIMGELHKADTLCHCDSKTKERTICEIAEAMDALNSILVTRAAEWQEVSCCRDRISSSLLALYQTSTIVNKTDSRTSY